MLARLDFDRLSNKILRPKERDTPKSRPAISRVRRRISGIARAERSSRMVGMLAPKTAASSSSVANGFRSISWRSRVCRSFLRSMALGSLITR